MFTKLGRDRLIDQRLTCLQELAKGELFDDLDCRVVFLPLIMQQLADRLDRRERLESCGKLLETVLERLYGKENTVRADRA